MYREAVAGADRGDRVRRRGRAQAHQPRAPRPGGYPTPASAHLSEQVEKVAGAAFPRRDQGRPGGSAAGIWLLPCGFPRSGREAQGWRPHGEVPQRLLSTGPAFRPCVSAGTTAGGDRRQSATPSKEFSGLDNSGGGEVRPDAEKEPSDCRAGGYIKADSARQMGQSHAQDAVTPISERRKGKVC